MWTMGGTIDVVQTGQAFYAMDTFGGQSGAPVFEPDLAACGGPCALVVDGYGLHGAAPHDTHNHGVRLDEVRAAAIALVAAANARTDDQAPTVTVTSLMDGATFAEGAVVPADYTCADEPTGSGLRHAPLHRLTAARLAEPDRRGRGLRPHRPRSAVKGRLVRRLWFVSGIAKVVVKRRLDDPGIDGAYWLSRPAEERVGHVQTLRADYYGWEDATGPRIQRVHRVLRRP